MKLKNVMRGEPHFRPDSLILIVDHYKVGQRIALMQLNYFGLTAHVVTSCRQAIRALKKHDYALVLIGWGMPPCDGSGCIKFIRRLEVQNNKTIIVAVTVHARVGDKERCIASGMDDLMSKPITLEDMQQLLGRHLNVS